MNSSRRYVINQGGLLRVADAGASSRTMEYTLHPDTAMALGLKAGADRRIKLVLSPGDVGSLEDIDSYLPGYSPHGGFLADIISPIRLVDKDIGRYQIYGMSNIFRLIHTETSYLAPVPKVDPETSFATYQVIQHAIGSIIAPNTERQASFPLRQFAARKIGDILKLRREYNVLGPGSPARTLNNWGTGQRVTLASNQAWNGGTSSDPYRDLMNRVLASTQEVTGIAMSATSAHWLVQHIKTRDLLRATFGDAGIANAVINAGAGPIPNNQAPRTFNLPGLPTIYVGGAKVQNDQTGALVDVMGNDVILFSAPGDAEWETIRTFQTFRTKGPSGTGYTSREIRDEHMGLEGVDMLVAGYAEANVMPTNTAGGLIVDAINANPT